MSNPNEAVETPAMPSLVLTVDQAALLALNLPEGRLRQRMDALSAKGRTIHGNHQARFVVGVSTEDRLRIRRSLKRLNPKVTDVRKLTAMLDALRQTDDVIAGEGHHE
jgi:hypothetical protein